MTRYQVSMLTNDGWTLEADFPALTMALALANELRAAGYVVRVK